MGFLFRVPAPSLTGLWMWGYNVYGMLGIGSTVNKSSPVQIAGTTWVEISCGDDTVIAIK